MDKKRIGIITHYYGSLNYGGVLQAYALTHVLNALGADAKQVQYKFRKAERGSVSVEVKKGVILFYELLFLSRRKYRFKRFRSNIPHSDEVYTLKTSKRINGSFDAFISGSDQVWNPVCIDDTFLLSFARPGKEKFSYAASVGVSDATDSYIKGLANAINDYKMITIRESLYQERLQAYLGRRVGVVLDPTLLVEKEHWDIVSQNGIRIHNYVFAYFLGDDIYARRAVGDFGRRHGLQVVSIPHAARFSKYDFGYADKYLYSAAPEDFVSLIKHADYIFTDSFHCVAFSCIYQKDFFFFERKGNENMSGRIIELARLFHAESNVCIQPEQKLPGYIENHLSIAYKTQLYRKAKADSMEWIKRMVIFI